MQATTAPTTASFIALGANLGDARATIVAAFDALEGIPRTHLLQRSPLYRTAPVDASGPDFINAVAALRTELGAAELLCELQRIEAMHGRERPFANAPRTLDLDLLLHGDEQHSSATLVIPHPRMHQRAFVLRPLHDIAPGLRLPIHGRVEDLLATVHDQPMVRLTD